MPAVPPRRNLTRLSRFILLAALTFGLAACQGDSRVTSPDGLGNAPGLSKAISDESNPQGTEGFNFIQPLSDPTVTLGAFDPNLSEALTVEVYEVLVEVDKSDPEAVLGGLAPPACGQGADSYHPLVAFSDPDVIDDVPDHYKVVWETGNGTAGEFYRVLVCLAGEPLGFADVYLGTNGGDAKRVQRNSNDQTHGRDHGADLPIKFHIDADVVEAVLCAEDPNCSAASVPSNPPSDVLIELETDDSDGDQNASIFIPQGSQFFDENGDPVDNATFTLRECLAEERLPDDQRHDGGCYVGETDPSPLEIADFYVFSICDIDPLATGLVGDQRGRASIVQFDVAAPPDQETIEFAQVLPHDDDYCDGLLASAEPHSSLGRLAQVVKDKLTGWLGPEPLIATSMVLHSGDGGRGDLIRSHYQAVLTSKGLPGSDFAADAETGQPETVDALIGGSVVPNPVVQVVDAGGDPDGSAGNMDVPPEPVEGATVRFSVEAGNGTLACLPEDSACTEVTPGEEYHVLSDGLGEAGIEWTVEETKGLQTMTARSKGMVGPSPDEDVVMPTLWPATAAEGSMPVRYDCGDVVADGNEYPCPAGRNFEGVITSEITFTADAQYNAIAVVDPGNGSPVTVIGATPLSKAQSVEDYYDWSPGSPNPSSSNTANPAIETADVSSIFLFEDTSGEGSSSFSLGMIHDHYTDDDGGVADIDLDWGTAGPPDGAVWLVQDDEDPGNQDEYPGVTDNLSGEPGVGDAVSDGTVHQIWADDHTDGFVIGPLSGPWAVDLTATFTYGAFGSTPKGVIEKLQWLNFSNSTPDPIEIANCTDDGCPNVTGASWSAPTVTIIGNTP